MCATYRDTDGLLPSDPKPHRERMPTRLPLPNAPALPWRPSLLIKASVACHVGAGLAVAPLPSLWPWALGAIAVNQAVLTAAGLLPRCTWLGANIRALPASAVARREVALTFDDGPDPAVTPALLDLLDGFGARATFFCIAQRARGHPALCRDIVSRGHSVQNHSDRHRLGFALSGLNGFRREIGTAQDTLADITGQLPQFFRAPAGLRNPFLSPVLEQLGLRLVSWTRRGFDTVQHRPQRVIERLSRRMAPGDILVLHDGNSARTTQGVPVVLDVMASLRDRLGSQRLRSVTLVEAFDAEPPA